MRKITILLVFLLFAGLQGAFAQKTITGKVTSAEDGLGMVGVPVVVKGTTIGTATDIDGAFSLNVPADAATLVVSFIGMKSVELPIGNQTVFNVELLPDIRALEDVIVTAFGISRQSKALTYAAQNVTSGALAEARPVNIVTGLSGRIAGLSVTEASTGVGADAKVLLRGNRSIAGSSEPLYVVDGITLNGGIANLSPDDIETISVLKGANAAALYGSRANNGAIIISTKSGKSAAEGVTANVGFTYTGSSPIHLLKSQDVYGQGANGIYAPAATVSWGPAMNGQMVDHWSIDPGYSLYGQQYAFSPQPDNITDFFRRGDNFATNVQVSVNTKTSNSAFSYTNTNAGGIVESNDLSSHNLSMRYTQTIIDKLTLDTKLNVIRRTFDNILGTGEGFDNPMRYLYTLPRNLTSADLQHYTFVNPIGQTRQHWQKVNDNGSGNPYWTINNVKRSRDEQRAIGMVSLKYQVTPELSILGRSAFDGTASEEDFRRANDTYTVAYQGSYEKNNSSSYEWNSDVLVNYNKKVGDLAFDVNAGANNRRYKYQRIGGSGVIFNIENLYALSNTANPRPYENYSEKEVQSAYGFAEIAYKNAIFLNITGRNDWSSTLPEANRSYFYPSVGLTAVVSDLVTLPEVFTHLKLRGSYAEVGNDTDPYQLVREATVGVGGIVTLSSKLPNANLKPERTKSIEVGFDLRMLEDRARLAFTYYKTNTYDQLFATPVPAPTGVASVFQNGADVQNTGMEITIGAAIIAAGDFQWDLDINWSKNSSKILDIAEGFDVLSFGTDFIREYKLVKGEAFGDIYAKSWLRDADGNVIIQDNGLPSITPGMTEKVANYNPDWLGGISNTFKYKNFTFSSLIDIRQGGSFISFTEAITAGNGMLETTLPGRDGTLLFGRDVFSEETGVTATGDLNTVPTDAETFWNNVGGRNNPAGGAFVRDASNIRMREMILGYDVPRDIVAKTFFKSARISLVGRNLFFITNKAKYVDPELMISTANTNEGREAFALPTTRTYGFSLNFGF